MSSLIMIIPSLCLCIGFYFGYKIGSREEIRFETPVQIIEKKKAEKKIKHKTNVLNQFMENLDNYPYNQKDIKE